MGGSRSADALVAQSRQRLAGGEERHLRRLCVRRALVAQRTTLAEGLARQTDLRAEVHQRLLPVVGALVWQRPLRQFQIHARRRLAAGPGELLDAAKDAPEDAADIRIYRCDGQLEGEAGHRARRVAPDALERHQPFKRVGQLPAELLDHLPRDAMQPHRALVVAQPRPRLDRLARWLRRQRRKRWEARQELAVLGQHALDLRLLEHHLRDEDGVRVACLAPGQMRAPLGGVPRQQRTPDLLAPLLG